jgi:transposase
MKKFGRSNALALQPAKHMINNTEIQNTAVQQYDNILLAIDTHAEWQSVARQIDSTPQGSQKMRQSALLDFAAKQTKLARKVYAVYEAGPFGFGLCRQLRALGVECYVVRPKKLDPYCKRVQTDKTDSQELLQDLDRYVRGNKRALAVIRIPTEEQEMKRSVARQRDALCRDLRSMAARGRGLLLYYGIRVSNHWHKACHWTGLQKQINPQLQAILQSYKTLIEAMAAQIRPLEAQLAQAAPKELPLGFGALTFELILREILSWDRFSKRRQVGGFMGLCGGVSSSGSVHINLRITKVGHKRLRTLLVELAWRMNRFQPNCPLIRKWGRILKAPHAAKSKRKQAIVAVARQLAVDIWKWQTGRTTPEALGWIMKGAAAV